MSEKPSPYPHAKFSPTMYVATYVGAGAGLTKLQLAQKFDVNEKTFRQWLRTKPALRKAWEDGKRQGTIANTKTTLREYVYGELSDEVRDVWDELMEIEQGQTQPAVNRVRALLDAQPDTIKQHLFLHAVVYTGFNVSGAMAKLNMSKQTYDRWVATDTRFAQLVDELHWHKMNFFECAFMDSVAQGDTQARIHAVKTFAAERGYNEKLKIEHSGTVDHGHHATLDLTDLDLDVDTQRKVLAAIRRKQQREALGPAALETPVIEGALA